MKNTFVCFLFFVLCCLIVSTSQVYAQQNGCPRHILGIMVDVNKGKAIFIEKTPYVMKEGVEKNSNDNGKLSEEGIIKLYYGNGRLWKEIPYKSDKKEGLTKNYN